MGELWNTQPRGLVGERPRLTGPMEVTARARCHRGRESGDQGNKGGAALGRDRETPPSLQQEDREVTAFMPSGLCFLGA